MTSHGDTEIDFVHDVCAKLPSQVVGELVGIPREDWPKIHAWSEQNSGGQDPDVMADQEPDYSASIEMALYHDRVGSSNTLYCSLPAPRWCRLAVGKGEGVGLVHLVAAVLGGHVVLIEGARAGAGDEPLPDAGLGPLPLRSGCLCPSR